MQDEDACKVSKGEQGVQAASNEREFEQTCYGMYGYGMI